MKKFVTLLAVFLLSLCSAFYVCAADGEVTYHGNAKEFIFAPGSEHSLTDLFPDFKGVMPGDTLTQKITVRNDASNNFRVNIYLRSLGAHETSTEFLSQLGLKVKKSEDNEATDLFDAAANETAQLNDWVHLGTLYPGGEVNLDVILEIPVELDNEFQERIGYLDWEFMVEELPSGGGGHQPAPPTATPPASQTGNPTAPQTGDNANIGLWLALMACSLFMIIILLIKRKKEE